MGSDPHAHVIRGGWSPARRRVAADAGEPVARIAFGPASVTLVS